LRAGSPYEIEIRNRRHDGTYRWFLTRALPLRDEQRRVTGWVGATTDIDDRKRSEEERELLLREFGRRIKNAFALVHALAVQTRRHSKDLEEFERAFLGRLDTLARVSALVGKDDLEAVDLRAVAEGVLEPHAVMGALHLAGPAVPLPAKTAHTLSLVLHELATNAAKYGALGKEGGTVELAWSTMAGPSDSELCLTWVERDGPEVREPTRRGFGRTLVEQTVTSSLGGSVKLDFPAEGVRCRIEIPLV
jgi:two-component sensor histidine kinase